MNERSLLEAVSQHVGLLASLQWWMLATAAATVYMVVNRKDELDLKFFKATKENAAVAVGSLYLVVTRAQVLRAVSDSDEVARAEYNRAFVAMQYFGYLRRDPEEPGFTNWLNTINANPNDYRVMVNGFLNSREYRLRFGRP